MKITIINCFPSNENNRIMPIMEYHEKSNDNVTVLTSDFQHYKKEKINLNNDNIIQFKVFSYKKNISISRILSHLLFSYKVYKYLLKNTPDVVYVKIPPNSLLFFLRKIKNKKKIFIIGDVYDLWPESMPSLNINKFPFNIVFKIWKSIREKNICCIDYTIYECNLYKEYMMNNGKCSTLYLCRDDYINYEVCNKSNISHVLKLCYLGNVGQLLDLELLEKFIKSIVKFRKVEFAIIGDGNSKPFLINMLKQNNVEVHDYGIVFDDEKKKEIMSECDFGVNLMKNSLLIGLSNKSIEYFKNGLPVINTINSDTGNLIKSFSAGYTFSAYTIDNLISWLINLDDTDLYNLKTNARNLFVEYFTKEVFLAKYDCINKEVINEVRNK